MHGHGPRRLEKRVRCNLIHLNNVDAAVAFILKYSTPASFQTN